MHPTNCKNCEAPLTGKFCSNCGQTADIHRVTFGHFLHEFFHAFTHADKGFLLLMKELVAKPGIVAREYLEGKRKKYFNPLTFLVIMSSLYAYVSYKTGYFEALSRWNNPNANAGGPAMRGVMKEAVDLIVAHGKIISLFLMPPLMAFFSWIFSIRSKNNLAENLVLNSFLMGQIYIVMIVVFMPAFVFIPGIPVKLNNNILHILMWIYMTVAYKQFFKNNIFWAAIKSVLIILFFIIFFWVLLYMFVVMKHIVFG